MTLHEFEDGVWYESDEFDYEYTRRGTDIISRNKGDDDGDALGLIGTGLALCTTFRPVATDPLVKAWDDYDRPAGAPPLDDFRAGWMARERVGFQIDVEAAMMEWAETGKVPWSATRSIIDRICSGEFRK